MCARGSGEPPGVASRDVPTFSSAARWSDVDDALGFSVYGGTLAGTAADASMPSSTNVGSGDTSGSTGASGITSGGSDTAGVGGVATTGTTTAGTTTAGTTTAGTTTAGTTIVGAGGA